MSRLSVWLMLVVAAVAWAAPEDPDPRFASAGFLTLGTVEYPSWVPQAPYSWDGRIVVVDGRGEMRRYTEQGTPDLLFGRNGVAEAPEYCPLPVPSDCWMVGIGVRPAGRCPPCRYPMGVERQIARPRSSTCSQATWTGAPGCLPRRRSRGRSDGRDRRLSYRTT